MKNEIYKDGFTQNRELSWLKFNDRVLSEAMDETVPLLERLKFLSIFTSNLDEFFMIRVGSLMDLMHASETAVDSKSGMTPAEQLQAIYTDVRPLYRKREEIFNGVMRALQEHGITQLAVRDLKNGDKKFVSHYFKDAMEPILNPQIVDSHHPFPHLQSKVMHVAGVLRLKNKSVFAMIPMPSTIPPLLFLPGDSVRFVYTSDILLERFDQMFTAYHVEEKVLLCITRNADIKPDDEDSDMDGDYRKHMQQVIRKRKRLSPVRLETSAPLGKRLQEFLCENLPVTEKQIFITRAPMDLSYVFSLPSKLPDAKRNQLCYPEFTPQRCADYNSTESVYRQVQRRDLLLSYPYESMEPFLMMLKEAANDTSVISIKITIYRLADHPKLVDYLCAAAENGKDVTVLIELRARFDEQNNIDWSKRLEDAGCTVLFGFEGYKVHSKICLITRREHGEIKYLTQIGTGNYNEKTAAMYTDFALFTTDTVIGTDAREFFKNMSIGNLDGEYVSLLVAPVSLKPVLLCRIDEEIAKGKNGRILLKLNSITDVDLMERLQAASEAGVSVTMIVRGICCLVPGVPEKTESITIRSLVGRFLEHSRVYCFGAGTEERMYISSADFMTRNTERRVEVACPVWQEHIRNKIRAVLDAALADNVKARQLLPDGTYVHIPVGGAMMDCQDHLMKVAQIAASKEPPKEHFTDWLKRVLFHK